MHDASLIDFGMVTQALGQIEYEARELCRVVLTQKPELRELIAPLERSIRNLDAIPIIERMRSKGNL